MKNEAKEKENEQRGTSALTRLLGTRKIKFRVWDSFNRNMITQKGALISDLKRFVDSANAHFEGGNGITIMQFAGIEDKNGKEVYHGDIYKNIDNGLIGVFEILSGIGGYYLNCREYKDGRLYNNHDFAKHDTTNFEVIGNVFETPELIDECT